MCEPDNEVTVSLFDKKTEQDSVKLKNQHKLETEESAKKEHRVAAQLISGSSNYIVPFVKSQKKKGIEIIELTDDQDIIQSIRINEENEES